MAGNIFMTVSREISRCRQGDDRGGSRLPPSPQFSACCEFFPAFRCARAGGMVLNSHCAALDEPGPAAHH
jgi:hypothetical protein